MNAIYWDMRYGLPNQIYLEFVANYLLQQEPGRQLVDPFALYVPLDKVEDVYVVREEVEKETNQLGTQIIIGPEGSGKTTLFEKLPTLLHGPALIVRLPLTEVGASVPTEELMEGKVSLLTAGLLVRYIFNAYWEDLLHAYAKRARFLPQLRQDRRWMEKLCWFYQRCDPLHAKISGEFELMVWLNASPSYEPFGPEVAPEACLRELVCFITSTVSQQERFGLALPRPYSYIQVLIDGNERLSNRANIQLIQDAQKLHDLHLGQVGFKLFVDSACREQIETMDCVRQGRVAVYCLPPWREQELRQMLQRRLIAWRRGEFADASVDMEYDWGRLIPDSLLNPATKSQFVQTIVEGALKSSEKEDDLDVPIHALRLARGLVAACAGCWKPDFDPPLNITQIKRLADLYWETT